MIWLTQLADVLRGRGLSVVEIEGWKTRSYPKWPGFVQTPTHVTIHHTASNQTEARDLDYILHATYAPISMLYLSRSGVFYTVAAGPACTSGEGHDWWGGGVPDNSMNKWSIGIEAANTGVGEPWPKIQTDAYLVGSAALCDYYQIPVDHVRGHWEWTDRKIDPAGPSPWATGTHSWDMDAFRFDVATHLNPPTDPITLINLEEPMQVLSPPVRVYDSRQHSELEAGEIRTISLAAVIPPDDPGGAGGIGTPPTRAAFVNLTVAGAWTRGYITVWGDGPMPQTSAVNYDAGENIANGVPVPVINQNIKVYTQAKCHLIVDVYGIW